VNPIKAFISILAVFLLGFVAVGFLLSGEWQATRTEVVQAPPDRVFDLLDSVEGWSRWSPMPFVEGEVSGPSEGAGARLAWDDPQWGQGVWTLTDARAPSEVRYRVEVEGGSMVTRGRVELTPRDGATHVTWTEEGDFGWNPLLAFMALGMERMQGEEMEKSLAELARIATGAPPSAAPAAGSDPADPRDRREGGGAGAGPAA
jgi:carbon monoxide dehydrogenase subunit G